MNTVEIELRINGSAQRLDVSPQVSLLDAVREYLGLTGTKKGCDQGACGACTVLADGRRINACLALAVQYQGREITTIEGVDHPLQEAFVRTDGFQCGYCTPGQTCSAIAVIEEHAAGWPSAATDDVRPEAGPPPLTSEEIRERMSGNLGRCGAYVSIVEAVARAAADSTAKAKEAVVWGSSTTSGPTTSPARSPCSAPPPRRASLAAVPTSST
ncbi:2Fe-2S iron-sulfur cluster-binding protein [Streptomyces sp. NPDC020794]|uniref:2Fe-2S iron-sulfur cluster-binding protein n=1 Tax=unclassified Streptomyces TaxID=2593676 RepID=UPI0036E7B2AE